MFRAISGVNLGSGMGEVTNPVGEFHENLGKWLDWSVATNRFQDHLLADRCNGETRFESVRVGPVKTSPLLGKEVYYLL